MPFAKKIFLRESQVSPNGKALPFTFDNLRQELLESKRLGYEFIGCHDFFLRKAAGTLGPKTVVLRVDVDFSLRQADALARLFRELNVAATFFIRLHADEYNPFSFENYLILKSMLRDGFEIGYHSEVVDEAAIWEEDAVDCLKRDVELLETIVGQPIHGIASHGGLTGLNNLDFWRGRTASEFGLAYEAYDTTDAFGLFDASLYVSDSEWTQWKCYDKGQLRMGDRTTPSAHCRDGHPLIYLLLHPEAFFVRHPYETVE